VLPLGEAPVRARALRGGAQLGMRRAVGRVEVRAQPGIRSRSCSGVSSRRAGQSRSGTAGRRVHGEALRRRQYSFLITKYEPRIVPASLDLWRANLNRDASSSGISIPSESLKPTARFSGPPIVYITLIDRPLS
jgi:hypothetical protein